MTSGPPIFAATASPGSRWRVRLTRARGASLCAQVMTAAQGYTEVPLALQGVGVYLKHVQCVRAGGDWTAEGPLCQRNGPVDYTVDAGDGVDVCPQDGAAPSLRLHSASPRLGAA